MLFPLSMGGKVVVSCSILFVLADLVITTVLYTHGLDFRVIRAESQNFNIFVSLLDLWGIVLLRVSLVLGGSLGVLWNGEDGPGRVSRLTAAILFFCMCVITYTLAKLLMLSESQNLAHQQWTISLMVWTCASSVCVLLVWNLLGKKLKSAAISISSNDGKGSKETEQPFETARVEDQGEGCQKQVKGSEEKQVTSSRATLGRLLSYCKKEYGLLCVSLFFLIISAVCEAFTPYYYGKAVESIVVHKSMAAFNQCAIIVTGLAFVSSFTMGVRDGVFTLTFSRLNLRLRKNLFRALMNQEIAFFDENHTGDIISRLTSDTTQVSDIISQNVNIFLRSIIKSIGFLIFMFGISWKLSLVAIMGFPFIGFVSLLYEECYKKLTNQVQATLAEANKIAEETISAMKTVRSFANEDGETDTYHTKLLKMFQLNKKQAIACTCYIWSSCMSELVLEVAILYYGGHLVLTSQMTSGELFSFFIYMLELGDCLENIASVYTGLMQGVGAAEKVFEYLDRQPKHPAEGKEVPDSCQGLVEFKDVTFAYPTCPDNAVLQGVSFTIRPGEVTALVGPSGSGKSSCVSLLEDFYPPQHGQVLLDGKPVHTLRHDYLHSKVSLVSQEPVLFARTVEKNITYGLTDVPREAVVQAASTANADDFISVLPKGYNTSVGERGTQLSGGQKQRVAIARALVRNPQVLILDEATSALDAESEHMVQQALNQVVGKHTVLLIAHRLSTVERADNIIVLDKGCVVEQGPHHQLMAKEGLYHRLVQRQLLDKEAD